MASVPVSEATMLEAVQPSTYGSSKITMKALTVTMTLTERILGVYYILSSMSISLEQLIRESSSSLGNVIAAAQIIENRRSRQHGSARPKIVKESGLPPAVPERGGR